MTPHQPKETNYLLSYVYDNVHPHAVKDAGDKIYSYDNNGNMTGWEHKQNGTRRVIQWNEENRVKQIDDNGKSTYFLYDDAGERVVKRGQHGESIYVNRFYSIRSGELGSKHVFAGDTRVVTKLVKTPPTNTTNTGTTTPTGEVPQYTATDFPNKGIQNALSNGNGKKLGIIKRMPAGTYTGINPPVEKDEFFYHGDHLGSSSIITDAYGAVYQHLEYFPYGETWIEEGGSYGGNTPGYKFTGKELDPETGLYYYGARYYDTTLSKWISADPILGKYLPSGNKEQDKSLSGMGGVYNPLNLGLYSYSHLNPIKYTDPDGREVYMVFSKKTETLYAIDLDRVNKSKPYIYSSPSEFKGRQNEVLIIKNVFTGENRYPGASKGSKNVPTPAGKYEILDNHLSNDHPSWYRLDALDSTPRDDFDDKGRGNFRLHAGGNSWGCVTICNVKPEYKAGESWQKLDEMLQGTTSTTVAGETKQKSFFGLLTNVDYHPLIRYGTMQIIE